MSTANGDENGWADTEGEEGHAPRKAVVTYAHLIAPAVSASTRLSRVSYNNVLLHTFLGKTNRMWGLWAQTGSANAESGGSSAVRAAWGSTHILYGMYSYVRSIIVQHACKCKRCSPRRSQSRSTSTLPSKWRRTTRTPILACTSPAHAQRPTSCNGEAALYCPGQVTAIRRQSPHRRAIRFGQGGASSRGPGCFPSDRLWHPFDGVAAYPHLPGL
ncbi:hypothetical protein J3F83DRAFT_120858 [Trichoderma novae-zelandiae]